MMRAATEHRAANRHSRGLWILALSLWVVSAAVAAAALFGTWEFSVSSASPAFSFGLAWLAIPVAGLVTAALWATTRAAGTHVSVVWLGLGALLLVGLGMAGVSNLGAEEGQAQDEAIAQACSSEDVELLSGLSLYVPSQAIGDTEGGCSLNISMPGEDPEPLIAAMIDDGFTLTSQEDDELVFTRGGSVIVVRAMPNPGDPTTEYVLTLQP
jgi:hypothetical protein